MHKSQSETLLSSTHLVAQKIASSQKIAEKIFLKFSVF